MTARLVIVAPLMASTLESSFLPDPSFTTSNLGTNDVKNKLNISISPNPAKDFINIQSDGKIKSVEIYNLHGQKLITTTQKQISISSLSSGIYLVRVEDDKNNTTTKKIIKK